MNDPSFWKKCSSCKKEIPFEAKYYLCSVSTCRNKRLGFSFCSIACWDAHLGFANHRSAEADELVAPTKKQFLEEQEEEKTMSDETQQKRTLVRPDHNTAKSAVVGLEEVETLVVVSKIKKLIRDQSDFNTSQCAIDALTQKVVEECLQAIEQAKLAGRKTVMGRDF